MLKLTHALNAWGTNAFESVLKNEIQQLDAAQLPLQQGLTQSSYVSDSAFSVTILNTAETKNDICIKAGIFYAGIIAGSCCSDDPTPVCEQSEYCELLFFINKKTAETTVKLNNETD